MSQEVSKRLAHEFIIPIYPVNRWVTSTFTNHLLLTYQDILVGSHPPWFQWTKPRYLLRLPPAAGPRCGWHHGLRAQRGRHEGRIPSSWRVGVFYQENHRTWRFIPVTLGDLRSPGLLSKQLLNGMILQVVKGSMAQPSKRWRTVKRGQETNQDEKGSGGAPSILSRWFLRKRNWDFFP